MLIIYIFLLLFPPCRNYMYYYVDYIFLINNLKLFASALWHHSSPLLHHSFLPSTTHYCWRGRGESCAATPVPARTHARGRRTVVYKQTFEVDKKPRPSAPKIREWNGKLKTTWYRSKILLFISCFQRSSCFGLMVQSTFGKLRMA